MICAYNSLNLILQRPEWFPKLLLIHLNYLIGGPLTFIRPSLELTAGQVPSSRSLRGRDR